MQPDSNKKVSGKTGPIHDGISAVVWHKFGTIVFEAC